jgi:plastocyanin
MDTGTTPTDTGTTPADTATSTTHTVNVGSGGNTFSPATLTAKVGDKVKFVWMGDAHTVTEANGTGCVTKTGGFDSGLRNTGANFEVTLMTAGTINYICTPHCALGMKGSITVNP